MLKQYLPLYSIFLKRGISVLIADDVDGSGEDGVGG
jgi:hypothetical protein